MGPKEPPARSFASSIVKSLHLLGEGEEEQNETAVQVM